MKGQDRSVELVDVFADDPVRGSSDTVDAVRGGTGLPRWSWLVAAAAALLVGGVLVLGRGRFGAAAPVGPAAPSAPASVRGPIGSVATEPATVVDVGHPLLAVPARWDLFGQGSAVVVRVELARGRITITRLPREFEFTPTTLIALPGRVVVRPVTSGVGYVVAGGAAASRLSGQLGQAGPVVPGPRAGQVWVRTSPASQDATRMTLIGPGASAAGDSIVVPGDGYLSGDGTGHVIYTTRVNNDSYLTSPGRWQVRTPGQFLAAGDGEVVTIERGRGGRYFTVVTDVPRGGRRVWPSPGFATDPVLGPVAPGGRTAAILTSASTATILNLLDLTNGERLGPGIALAGNAESVAWAPNGRWLFAATSGGQVVAIDAATAAVHRLGVYLPPLTQLVVRP